MSGTQPVAQVETEHVAAALPGLPLPLSARTSPVAVSPEHSMRQPQGRSPGSMETSRGPGAMGVAAYPLLAACMDGPPEQGPLFP